MLDAYQGWQLFHHTRIHMSCRVAGVYELVVGEIPLDLREEVVSILKRGYTLKNDEDDPAHRLINALGSIAPDPFTLSYIGKTKLRVYTPAFFAIEARQAINALRTLIEDEDLPICKLTAYVTHSYEYRNQACFEMRRYLDHVRNAKTAHMKDQFMQIRPILKDYINKDSRRGWVIEKLLRSDTIFRIPFRGEGKNVHEAD